MMVMSGCSQINLFLFLALFEAVEQQDLDLVKNLLEVDGLNINR